MRHIIHIHQQKLKRSEPAIIDRTYKGSHHARQVTIFCPSCGEPAAEVVQPKQPDSCGARAFIVTDGDTWVGELDGS